MKSNLYLSTLRLKNFATFRDEEIHFNRGFNAIIGETGSGKSLVLDALQLIFGGRADKKTVRKGSDFAIIEAIFSNIDDNIRDYLAQSAYPVEGDEIVLKRIITPSGGSKSFLNFQQCPLATLGDFSRRFTDLVGQFENQKLLSETYQLTLLDSYSKCTAKVGEYQSLYKQIDQLKEDIQTKSETHKELIQKKDYIEFQLKELEELNPSVEDEERLLQLKESIVLQQQHQESIANAIQLLSENDDFNVQNTLQRLSREFERLPGNKIQQIATKLSDAVCLVEDISYDLQRSLEVESVDEDLDSIIDKLDRYQRLKRKFHLETDELVQLFEKFSKELRELHEIESQLKELNKQLVEREKQAQALAMGLHQIRVRSAQTLSKELTSLVQRLKMNGATLRFELETTDELNKTGCSRIHFYAETNPGEGYFKVKEIASGGELSRILLALRQILSANDTISIFLFDEIDTGVGGETALAIGQALRHVSTSSQVIAITHLPQIAHYAESLCVIKKETIREAEGERTVSLSQSLMAQNKDNYVQNMASLH